MASQTFNVSITMPDTAPVGNVPKSFAINLTAAEAKTLRQLRDGYVGSSLQPSTTGVARTIRVLLQQIAASLP